MSIRFPASCRMAADRSAWASHVARQRWERVHAEAVDAVRADLPDLVRRITLEDFVSGRKVVFDLKRCSRIDQYRVEVDGRLWRDACGLAGILAGIGTAGIDWLAICMPKTLFQKGHDPRRNTKGRTGPRGFQIPDLLHRVGQERLPEELRGKLPAEIRASKTKLEALMRAVYLYALKGESWAVQFIADRTEGKVKDTIHLEGGTKLEIVEELVDADQS